MIKVDKEQIRVSGSKLVVKAEFSYLIHSLINEGIFDKDEIMSSVEIGCMTDEEREKEIIEFKERFEKFAEGKKGDSGEDDVIEKAVRDLTDELKRGIM